jgi:hypothetical protein
MFIAQRLQATGLILTRWRIPAMPAATSLPLRSPFAVFFGRLRVDAGVPETSEKLETTGNVVVTPAGFEPAISTLKGSRRRLYCRRLRRLLPRGVAT